MIGIGIMLFAFAGGVASGLTIAGEVAGLIAVKYLETVGRNGVMQRLTFILTYILVNVAFLFSISSPYGVTYFIPSLPYLLSFLAISSVITLVISNFLLNKKYVSSQTISLLLGYFLSCYTLGALMLFFFLLPSPTIVY
jgi:hypothetical protein